MEGVLVADTDADSHVPPSKATDTGFAILLVAFTVCEGGTDPPPAALKFRDEMLRVTFAPPLTVSVTGIERGLLDAPAEVMLIAPV